MPYTLSRSKVCTGISVMPAAASFARVAIASSPLTFAIDPLTIPPPPPLRAKTPAQKARSSRPPPSRPLLMTRRRGRHWRRTVRGHHTRGSRSPTRRRPLPAGRGRPLSGGREAPDWRGPRRPRGTGRACSRSDRRSGSGRCCGYTHTLTAASPRRWCPSRFCR